MIGPQVEQVPTGYICPQNSFSPILATPPFLMRLFYFNFSFTFLHKPIETVCNSEIISGLLPTIGSQSALAFLAANYGSQNADFCVCFPSSMIYFFYKHHIGVALCCCLCIVESVFPHSLLLYGISSNVRLAPRFDLIQFMLPLVLKDYTGYVNLKKLKKRANNFSAQLNFPQATNTLICTQTVAEANMASARHHVRPRASYNQTQTKSVVATFSPPRT